MMKRLILSLVFLGCVVVAATAQLNIGNPFFVAGTLKPAAAGGGGGGPPVIDTQVYGETGANASYNTAITVANNANRILVVFCLVSDSGTVTNTAPSGGGATWSLVGSSTGNGTYKGSIWKGVNPSTGSQTITLNASAAPSALQACIIYSVYTASTVQGYVGTTTGNNVITVASGSMAFGAQFDGSDTRTVSGCTTTRDISGFASIGYAAAHCTTSPSSTFTWSAFGGGSIAMGCEVVP